MNVRMILGCTVPRALIRDPDVVLSRCVPGQTFHLRMIVSTLLRGYTVKHIVTYRLWTRVVSKILSRGIFYLRKDERGYLDQRDDVGGCCESSIPFLPNDRGKAIASINS